MANNEIIQRDQNHWHGSFQDLTITGVNLWRYAKFLRGSDYSYTAGDPDYKAGFDNKNLTFKAPASPDAIKVFKFRMVFEIDWRWTDNADTIITRCGIVTIGTGHPQSFKEIGFLKTFLGIKDKNNKWEGIEDSWYDCYPPVENVMTGLFVSDPVDDTYFSFSAMGQRGWGHEEKYEYKEIICKRFSVIQLSDVPYST